MTAGIVGLGLIGGSLAKAYHEAGERVLAHDIDRVANQQETFIEEFSNILQRNLGAQPGTPAVPVSASGH